jgi:hypothetical protein
MFGARTIPTPVRTRMSFHFFCVPPPVAYPGAYLSIPHTHQPKPLMTQAMIPDAIFFAISKFFFSYLPAHLRYPWVLAWHTYTYTLYRFLLASLLNRLDSTRLDHNTPCPASVMCRAIPWSSPLAWPCCAVLCCVHNIRIPSAK